VALLTYYDDSTGERTELGAGDLGVLAAATAALLTEGCGIDAGGRIAVRLPPHWQTAAILLGAWAAGIEVSWQGWATAGLGGPTPAVDAAFVSAARARGMLEDPPVAKHLFVLGLAPHGGPTPTVPDGYHDYLASLHPYADAAPPAAPVALAAAATVDGTTYDEWGGLASGLAAQQGLVAGDRVLIDASRFDQPVQWLLAPLTAGASIVLCANLDQGKLPSRVETERVTRLY
jgi:uncharacterized protein (TIGR03089 family)